MAKYSYIKGFTVQTLSTDTVTSAIAGAIKTKEEAQAIVTGEIEAAQAAWDALSAEEQAERPGGRPVVYNLP